MAVLGHKGVFREAHVRGMLNTCCKGQEQVTKREYLDKQERQNLEINLILEHRSSNVKARKVEEGSTLTGSTLVKSALLCLVCPFSSSASA